MKTLKGSFVATLFLALMMAIPAHAHAGGRHHQQHGGPCGGTLCTRPCGGTLCNGGAHHHHGHERYGVVVPFPFFFSPPIVESVVVVPSYAQPQYQYVVPQGQPMAQPQYVVPQGQSQVMPPTPPQTQILPKEPSLPRVPVQDRSKINVIVRHIYGEPIPPDLPEGGIVKICNAKSGEYPLGNGERHFHQQQCWWFENPIGGNPLKTPAPPEK